jgi:hypothetical protein
MTREDAIESVAFVIVLFLVILGMTAVPPEMYR